MAGAKGTVAVVAVLGAAVLIGRGHHQDFALAADTGVGYVRAAHLSPDTAPFTAEFTAEGAKKPAATSDPVSYGALTQYQRLPAGTYTFTARGAGTGEKGEALLSERVTVEAGKSYTLAVTGPRARLALRVIGDDVQASKTQARVRVINAAARLDPARVAVEGYRVLFPAVGFGTVSGYAGVPAGRRTMAVGAGESTELRQSVDFRANTVYTMLLVLDPDGKPRLAVQRDAVGAATPPTGPVETGLGGTAGRAGLTYAMPPVLAAVPVRVGRPVPTEVDIPAIDVRSAVGGIHLGKAGQLVPPAQYDRVGWYDGGPAPGEAGAAVLAGHVDSRSGPAVFYRLGTLHHGDEITVRRSDGSRLRYVVTSVRRYAKSAFPADWVYAPRPDTELRLITCGGTFDAARHSYRDNVVVTAVPDSTR